jgi:hypothetical protein
MISISISEYDNREQQRQGLAPLFSKLMFGITFSLLKTAQSREL